MTEPPRARDFWQAVHTTGLATERRTPMPEPPHAPPQQQGPMETWIDAHGYTYQQELRKFARAQDQQLAEAQQQGIERCLQCAHPDLGDAHPDDSWHRGWHDEQSELQHVTAKLAEAQRTEGALRAALKKIVSFPSPTTDWASERLRCQRIANAALSMTDGERSAVSESE